MEAFRKQKEITGQKQAPSKAPPPAKPEKGGKPSKKRAGSIAKPAGDVWMMRVRVGW